MPHAISRLALATCGVVVLAGCGSTVQGASVGQPGISASAGSDGVGVGNKNAPGTPLPQQSVGIPAATSQGAAEPTAPGQAQAVPSTTSPASTARRQPIRVGLFYATNDAEASTGTDNGQTFSLRKALEAAVAAANKRGGVASRIVQPVYYPLNATSTPHCRSCPRYGAGPHTIVTWQTRHRKTPQIP